MDVPSALRLIPPPKTGEIRVSESQDKPLVGVMAGLPKAKRSQEYYDSIKQKFAEERDLRLKYRPEGTKQYTSDLTGNLARYEIDTYGGEVKPREPINDTVECLFIGGGFSALLTSARLREYGVESIRIVERGADVGGTWYWNRYPGAACDVVSYDYLPLLDEMNYVPTRHYAEGPEIFAHCQAIARKYNLYELAVFQTTVTSTTWNETEQMWHIETNRGDHLKAKFVICANGTLSKPKLSKIKGMNPSRATHSIPRVGITRIPSRTCRDCPTRWSGLSGREQRRSRPSRIWVWPPRSYTYSSAHRHRSIFATTG